MLVLAVLVIATVALTGVATATTPSVPITPIKVNKLVGIEAQGAYLGVPIVIHPAGVQYPVIGYVYTFFPNGDYVLTYENGLKRTVDAETAKAVSEALDVAITNAPDRYSHSIFGGTASDVSYVFENGRPAKTVYGPNGASNEKAFDSEFFAAIDLATGYTPLIESAPFLNSWNLWML
jgi:hypothetical protein